MSVPDPRGTVSLATTRRGVWLGVGSGVLAQVLSVVGTMVLARLLVPADFGMVAAAALVTGLVETATISGIAVAVLRLPELEPRRLATLTSLAVAVSLVCATATWAAAPLVAQVNGEPGLAPFVSVIAGLFVVRMSLPITRPLLQRRLRFGTVYGVDAAGVATLVVTQVACAVAGLGAWSFVVGQYAQAVVVVTAFWVASRFRPRLALDRTYLREQLAFGGKMWLAGVLRYPNKNSDNWVVSVTMGVAALGAYSIAYVLPNILRQRITTATADVMTPTYARLSDEPDRLRGAYVRTLRMHAAVGFPAMTGLALLSPAVVEVFFGPRWAAAAAPMALICLASAFDFVTMPTGSLLMSQGLAGRLARIQLHRFLALAAGLAVAVPLASLSAVAAAVAWSALVAALSTLRSGANALDWSLRRSASALAVPLLASIAMGVLLLLTGTVVRDIPPVLLLPTGIVTGAGAYVAAVVLFSRRQAREILDDVRVMLPARLRGTRRRT